MNEFEYEVKREYQLTRELIESWERWHCHDSNCKDHMCRVRAWKLHQLDLKIRRLNVKLKFIQEVRRQI